MFLSSAVSPQLIFGFGLLPKPAFGLIVGHAPVTWQRSHWLPNRPLWTSSR
jgi:hypothetical protein